MTENSICVLEALLVALLVARGLFFFWRSYKYFQPQPSTCSKPGQTSPMVITEDWTHGWHLPNLFYLPIIKKMSK